MFVFKKCDRQRAIKKATPKTNPTLKRLRAFLKAEEPQAVHWLVNTWNSQQATVTYKELREAVLSGGITEAQLQKWQKDYAKLVNEKLAPQWAKAMSAAAEERKQLYPNFLYEPNVGAAQEYIKQQGAALVTNMTQSQRDALQVMVAQAAHYEAMTTDSLSRLMRPVIGLTAPQAVANLNYYNSTLKELTKAHPRTTQEALEKRAREAAMKYAGQQHRYRAQNIARTELAFAYNQGAYGATMDAQAQGYIGDCKKTWLTAADERVCEICGGLDGESVNMNAYFSIGVQLPPAHPYCRCAVAFEEIAPSLAPTTESTIAEPQTIPTQPTGPTVEPQGTEDTPLPLAGEAVLPEPEAPASDGILRATEVFEDLSKIPH